MLYGIVTTQKCAIKTHHCCQVETIVLYQLVFTVKTVKIQLDCLGMLWAYISLGTSKVTMAITHTLWYNFDYLLILLFKGPCRILGICFR